MKFVIALFLANASAISLNQMQSLITSVYQDGLPAELGAAGPPAAAPAPAAAAPAPAAKAAPAAAPATAAAAPLSPKQEAAAKAAAPIVEAVGPAVRSAPSDANVKEAKAKQIAADNQKDMASSAALFGGPGAPPPLSRGDIETMAAPRPGFDPSLNPHAPNVVESTHTTMTAAAEAAFAGAQKADGAKTAPVAPAAGLAQASPKVEAAAAAAKPVAPATQPGEMHADEAANKAEAKAAAISKQNEGDMGSTAATWAGHGTPPDLSVGDVATMAAPRPGFDPSLNPGAPGGIESSNTTNTASREAALTAPVAEPAAAAVQTKPVRRPAPTAASAKGAKKPAAQNAKSPAANSAKAAKTAPNAAGAKRAPRAAAPVVARALSQAPAAAAKSDPTPPAAAAEPSTKQQAAIDAAKPLVKKVHSSEADANVAANAAEANAAKIGAANERDMGSTAAIWAGPGAPPQITAGDTAVMAAPRPGFDPSLNPGTPGAIESTNTTNVAAEHAAPTTNQDGTPLAK